MLANCNKLRGVPEMFFESCPLIGSLSEVSNLVTILDAPEYHNRIRALYTE